MVRRLNAFHQLPVWPTVLLLIFFGLVACSDEPDGLPQPDSGQDYDAGVDDAATDDTDLPPHQDAGPSDPDADRPDEDSGQDWDWDDDDFRIDAVIPARGPVEGGTLVHVTGADLSEDTELLFGNQPADVTVSHGQLVAHTPPATTHGPVNVRAISPNGEVSEIANGFTYADSVRVDNVVPDIVPTTGGFEITLYGSGFGDPMGVSFDGVPARRINVVTDSIAHVVVPPMNRGSADLRVSAPDASDVVEDAVYFFDPIEIDLVEPAVGDVSGGELVTISAKGITSDVSVRFGDRPADVEFVNVAAQTVTVSTPSADSAGPVDVVLENEYDTERLSQGFVYDDGAQDVLYSVQPHLSELAGGTQHLVSGRNLDASDVQILIDGSVATIVDTASTHARIEAPSASSAGLADISLVRDGLERDRLDDALRYVAPLHIDEVVPNTGSTDGGETVAIYGEGLSETQRVSFGGRSASFEVIDDGELLVTTPQAEAGSVDVTVSDTHRDNTLSDGFYFETDLQVWSMTPSRGAMAGNTFVTLRGVGFDGNISIDVGGESASDVRRLDPYTVTFRTPPSSTTGARDVVLSAMEQQAEPPYPFVYYQPLSSFGGAWGSRIDGTVNVSVLAIDGSPVPNAFVMLSLNPDTPYRGYTNAQGQITLSGPDIRGPQTITATAAGLSTFTVRELNAENVTLILDPTEPADGDGGGEIQPPPMSTFRGNVTITGKGSDPHGGVPVYDMTMVRTTRSAIGGFDFAPGADSVIDGEGSYELRSRVGDVALIALCGRYFEEEDYFKAKMMAVKRNFSVGNGQVIDADLECNIPLESSIPIRIQDPVYAPDGPTSNRIQPYLDFGYEGVFRMPEPITGLDDILYAEPLPAPEGPLENISYAAVVGSYTDGGIPYSRTTIKGINDVGHLQSTRPLVAVPELIKPEQGAEADGEIRLGLKGINEPDFHYIILRNSYGLPAWKFLAPGHHRIIPLPEFPSFSDLPSDQRPDPYQSGTLFTTLYTPQIDGFDYHSFTFGQLGSGRWDAFGIESTTMILAE